MTALNFSNTLKRSLKGILFAFPKIHQMNTKHKQGILEFQKDAFHGMRRNQVVLKTYFYRVSLREKFPQESRISSIFHDFLTN
jgi:hypothetical protein